MEAQGHEVPADLKVVWRGPAKLGEGPLWHPKERVLYWLDCIAPDLHRLDPATGKHTSWRMPALIGSIAPREPQGLVAAIGTGVAFISIDQDGDEEKARVDMQHEVIDSKWGVRLNDGKCDRQGRFWAGTVASDFNASVPNGVLYRCDKGKITEMRHGIKVSNGLGWSLDNKVMYYTDSLAHKIFRYDFDPATGDISNETVFAEIPESEGVPDGLTVDAEGYVWSAHWNGWKVTRYRPDGSVERVLKVPVQRPTSVMFGGDHLDTLYITSASQDVGENQPLPGEQPHGALLAIKIDGIKGLPEPSYLG